MLPMWLVACAPDPAIAVVEIVEGHTTEIVRGARIALVETRGEGDERETRLVGSGCVDVVDAVPNGESLSVSVAGTVPIPAGAVVRAAICRSDATPLARARPEQLWAMAIPSEVPHDFGGDLVSRGRCRSREAGSV